MIVNVVLVACLSVMEGDIQNLLISKQMITEQHQAVNAAAAVHICEGERLVSDRSPTQVFGTVPDTFEDSSPTILLYVK